MDWIQLTSIATLMSGLGACASAVATWRTVREMRKQRESSHMPQLACSLPAVISEGEPFFTLFNVGLDTARDVDVTVSMPFDFLDALNNMLEKEHVRIRVQDGRFHIESALEDGGTACHSISTSCHAHVRFLVPGMEHGARLRLPGYLPELANLLAEKRLPESRERFRAILDGLHLDIAVDFSDIGGQRRGFRQRYAIFDADYTLDQKRLRLRFA